MCIILFQWQPGADTPLVLAANRDEFYARPTESARWRGDIFCGIDKEAGGTWFGVTQEGRFAAVTNFRESLTPLPATLKSRGKLPLAYLEGAASPKDYVHHVQPSQEAYGPFNLLVGDKDSLWYIGNRGAAPQEVPPGLHGLSNALLNTSWPKIERGKDLLARAIEEGGTNEQLLAVLTDRHQPDASELPQTGVPAWLEEMVAPIFIESAQYGTRCSTLLVVPREGAVRVHEHVWR